jgi:hypothetical protein
MPDAKTEELKQEIVANPGKTSSRTAYRAQSGMFQKAPRAPNALEVQRATAALLTAVTPAQPESAWERMTKAMIELAANPNEKTASASVKAYEALHKASGFAEQQPEYQRNLTVVIAMPNLPCQGELVEVQNRPPLRPTFPAGEPQYLEGEIVQQNPAPAQVPLEKPKLTLAQLQRAYDDV